MTADLDSMLCERPRLLMCHGLLLPPPARTTTAESEAIEMDDECVMCGLLIDEETRRGGIKGEPI